MHAHREREHTDLDLLWYQGLYKLKKLGCLILCYTQELQASFWSL